VRNLVAVASNLLVLDLEVLGERCRAEGIVYPNQFSRIDRREICEIPRIGICFGRLDVGPLEQEIRTHLADGRLQSNFLTLLDQRVGAPNLECPAWSDTATNGPDAWVLWPPGGSGASLSDKRPSGGSGSGFPAGGGVIGLGQARRFSQ